ncbi:universal stress protein [Pseudovibrio exalbescens]|uniref:Universal stress protein UspA n=1 Tax=Pseudovibrio exalbescens TaxID=197461 RepID=A0A1U7JFJ7_9HYPH|nr:universal stress protein [Pseudovibrio exalbescens]OKL43513.1 universal stress protein UspA [Pseudovibrio exalbescens]
MYSNILLPVDLNEESSWKKSLPIAVDLAKHYNAELHVVSVMPDFGKAIVGGYFKKEFEHDALEAAKVALEELLDRELPDDTLKVKGHIAHGTIYEEINKAADKLGTDLIVLASHRPELRDYLLGPNAARVVRHANQSVMVVRGDE